MDWKAHELAQRAARLADLGLQQTEAHPLDRWRFRFEAAALHRLLGEYLGEGGVSDTPAQAG